MKSPKILKFLGRCFDYSHRLLAVDKHFLHGLFRGFIQRFGRPLSTKPLYKFQLWCKARWPNKSRVEVRIFAHYSESKEQMLNVLKTYVSAATGWDTRTEKFTRILYKNIKFTINRQKRNKGVNPIAFWWRSLLGTIKPPVLKQKKMKKRELYSILRVCCFRVILKTRAKRFTRFKQWGWTTKSTFKLRSSGSCIRTRSRKKRARHSHKAYKGRE